MSMTTVKKDRWNRVCRLLTSLKHPSVPTRQFYGLDCRAPACLF
jgi:hypothetical protein